MRLHTAGTLRKEEKEGVGHHRYRGVVIIEFVVINALMALAVLLMPLLVAWQARPGATPSAWSGLRTEKTRVNADTWQAGHRAALPAVRFGGLISFVFAGGGVVTAMQGWQGFTMMCALAAGAATLVTAGVGVARANDAAEEVLDDADA